MSQKRIGIDIGSDELKLAEWDGNKVKRTARVPMPQGMVENGVISSYKRMGKFIRKSMRKKHIHGKKCAVVLPTSHVLLRRFTMAELTHKQILFNLPFEFRDYLTADKDTYFFDYAVLRRLGINGEKLDIVAAAISKAEIKDYALMAKRAGLKLQTAIPTELALSNVLQRVKKDRQIEEAEASELAEKKKKAEEEKKAKEAKKRSKKKRPAEEAIPVDIAPEEPAEAAPKLSDLVSGECAFLDVGHSSFRLHIFKDGFFEVTRVVNIGMADVYNAIRDSLGVDEATARTLCLDNDEGAENAEAVQLVYAELAADIRKAVNFYLFNSKESDSLRVLILGGNTEVTALRDAVAQAERIDLHSTNELLSASLAKMTATTLAAVGAAMQ